MLVTETVTINDKEFVHNYSNAEYYIQKKGTDEIYSDAYDLPEMGYTYTETDKKIEPIPPIEELINVYNN